MQAAILCESHSQTTALWYGSLQRCSVMAMHALYACRAVTGATSRISESALGTSPVASSLGSLLGSSPSGAFIQREQHASQLGVRSHSGQHEPVVFQTHSLADSFSSTGLQGIFGDVDSPLSHGSPYRRGIFGAVADRERSTTNTGRDRDRNDIHGVHAQGDVDVEDDDLFGCVCSTASPLTTHPSRHETRWTTSNQGFLAVQNGQGGTCSCTPAAPQVACDAAL